MSDKTIRELQAELPWTEPHHRICFGHALLHVHKAEGKLTGFIDDGVDWANPLVRAEVEKYLADLVICALRMATTCPHGQLDLQAAVARRLKNSQLVAEADAPHPIGYEATTAVPMRCRYDRDNDGNCHVHPNGCQVRVAMGSPS